LRGRKWWAIGIAAGVPHGLASSLVLSLCGRKKNIRFVFRTESTDVAAVKLRKKVYRNSTMEGSLVGFLHRRGIIVTNGNTSVSASDEKQAKRKWSKCVFY